MRADTVCVIVQGPGGIEPLLDLLASLMPIRFERRAPDPERDLQTMFSTTGALGTIGRDCTSVTLTITAPTRSATAARVSFGFASDARVPFPFSGRRLASATRSHAGALRLAPGEHVLATAAVGPVWTVRDDDRDGARHFRSALPLPATTDATSFFDIFNAPDFVDALPLIEFCRLVSGDADFTPPRVRASFVIDDPNLHWPRYGFVDYRQVVAHAKAGGYHVCFATIPLDTWFTHRSTAAVFRGASDQVSLLVHGNDHVRAELTRSATTRDCHALLRQSLQRMERLARNTGLRFSRVMVPPHGACDFRMLASLPPCGFEAACISSGSLRAHNAQRPWTRTLGYRSAEFVEGCLVMPRWGLGEPVENTVALAAYLGQAIVLMGHHADLANDLVKLDRAARIVNDLGSVSWCDMQTLSRSSYLQTREGSTLEVRAEEHRLRIATDGIDRVAFVPVGGRGVARNVDCAGQAFIDIHDAERVSGPPTSYVERDSVVSIDRRTRIRPVVRRLLTEARDRFAPIAQRIAARRQPVPKP